MAKTKEKGSDVASDELLAQLDAGFQREQGGARISLPRLAFASQDKFEGKGKLKKVVTEAGTFSIERECDEIDPETGKKVWEKKEIGPEVEVTVLYKRHQLRHFDESTEEFTSSPIYDAADEVLPLFRNGKEVARGTPAELQAREEFQGVSKKTGKPISNLEVQRVLYVLLDGEPHQLNLRGSSMYAWLKYERSTPVAGVLTRVNSEPKQNGTVEWNQMTFAAVRKLTREEAERALELTAEFREMIAASKAQFAAPALAAGAGKPADDDEDEEEDLDEVADSLAKKGKF